MNGKLFPMSGLTILLLVVLRVTIGWHFFNEGRDHYFDKKWSSAPFLKNAVGPFAPQAKTMLAQNYGWEETIDRPFTEEEYKAAKQLMTGKPEADPKASTDILDDKYPLYTNPIYGAWAIRVRDAFQKITADYVAHYNFDGEKKNLADAALKRDLKIFEEKLQGYDGLYEYRAELRRLENWKADPSTSEVPFEIERVKTKTKDLAGRATPWLNDMLYVEDILRSDLQNIAGETIVPDELAPPSPKYKKIDPIVIWTLMIAGGCMIVGLFTRLASFVGGAFLLSVVALQPFWTPLAAATYFQWVELIACFALATTGVGRYLGLDFFLHALFGRKDPETVVVRTR